MTFRVFHKFLSSTNGPLSSDFVNGQWQEKFRKEAIASSFSSDPNVLKSVWGLKARKSASKFRSLPLSSIEKKGHYGAIQAK